MNFDFGNEESMAYSRFFAVLCRFGSFLIILSQSLSLYPSYFLVPFVFFVEKIYPRNALPNSKAGRVIQPASGVLILAECSKRCDGVTYPVARSLEITLGELVQPAYPFDLSQPRRKR
ncbi:MAG: hypothetical protein NTX45_09110, partial [Proteobacteria bacterium]|nr:hypothetical protein [Pseudomonadota bacterium]